MGDTISIRVLHDPSGFLIVECCLGVAMHLPTPHRLSRNNFYYVAWPRAKGNKTVLCWN